jgi:hypothetical protein
MSTAKVNMTFVLSFQKYTNFYQHNRTSPHVFTVLVLHLIRHCDNSALPLNSTGHHLTLVFLLINMHPNLVRNVLSLTVAGDVAPSINLFIFFSNHSTHLN